MDKNTSYLMTSLKTGALTQRPLTPSVSLQNEKYLVPVQVAYSSLNYKDALALTGEGTILKSFPMVPGIDLSGTILEDCEGYSKGELVLATGCGLGEIFDGGYQERALLPPSAIIRMPEKLDARLAMILGTAGFTAGLCIDRMEALGQIPSQGPIVVTGASGGVGSLATHLLSRLGYEVIAISGKADSSAFLKELGASSVKNLAQLDLDLTRPLAKARFGGAIDNLGGNVLEGLLKSTHLWGSVCSVGLALSPTFKATVMPHILRGVSLLGISSANCPRDLRQTIWSRLSLAVDPQKLELIFSQEIQLEELLTSAQNMLKRKTRGRTLVKILHK